MKVKKVKILFNLIRIFLEFYHEWKIFQFLKFFKILFLQVCVE